MCLDMMFSKSPEPEGVGYKYFRKNDCNGFLRHGFQSGLAEIGRWDRAYKVDIWFQYGTPSTYISGFHILVDKENAKLFDHGNSRKGRILRKVYYRNGRILGRQAGIDAN